MDNHGDAVPQLLTAQQAAARLGCGKWKLYQLLRSGALPSVRIGALRRVSESALAAFIAAGGADVREPMPDAGRRRLEARRQGGDR